MALGNTIWAKYKVGEAFKIIDPETNAPAVKNPFLHPKPGVLLGDEVAVDRLLASGVIIGACDIALHGQSKRLASNAGVSADDAAKEWAANIVPGITIVPSGVWGLNRAQEAGCTYCSGGG
jgi:intracellular sulfur oxidation DsrE/DsrF family protein